MNDVYTKQEVDNIVTSMEGRLNTAEGTLRTANTNITTHLTAQNAHNNILADKANVGTVNDLSDEIDALDARLRRYENEHPVALEGTVNYDVSGNINDDSVDVHLDIQPIDPEHPVVYEKYGDDSELLDGLEFDANAGTVSGTPSISGTCKFTVLAKSGNYGAFVDINQTYVHNNPSNGYNELVAIIRKLRTGDLSSIELGTEFTIPVSGYTDLSYDSIRFTTGYSQGYSEQVIRFVQYDTEKNMYKWSHKKTNGGYTYYYTKEYSFGGGTRLYSEDLTPLGLVPSGSASYIKNVTIRLVGINIDTPTSGDHFNTARFAFINAIGELPSTVIQSSAYWRSHENDIESYADSKLPVYFNSKSFDGFLKRIPLDLRNLFVPVTIECSYYNSGNNIASKPLSNQLIFLPSREEVESSDRIRYSFGGSTAVAWYLRNFEGYYRVDSTGSINGNQFSCEDFAPVFVIG